MSTKKSDSALVAKTGFFTGLHPGMGLASKLMIAAFVIFTILNVDFAGSIYSTLRGWVEAGLSWYYILLLAGLLTFCIILLFTKWGNLRLGADDSRPEFSNFSWFAMLFSAGVGIGVLFFGVSEPVFYFDNSGAFGYPNNPHADMRGNTEMTIGRAVDAMRVTFFHWGLHGWAGYAIVGLCLAYFGFRKGLPLTMRSSLHPILGDRIYGPLGHAVDLLAVFGTVFGVATSLGLGVSQMAAGLERLFGISSGILTQIILIAIVSAIATMSTVSGVGKGIRIISELNVRISIVLVLSFLIIGPFVWQMNFFVTAFGDYVWNVIPMGFWTANEAGEVSWQGGWTIFYWGWWISWAPFVGMFIARISRGRTIREFMMGVLFIPTVIAFFWLSIFGGNAIWQELNAVGGPAAEGGAGIIETVRAWNLPAALFGMIDNLGTTSWIGDISWVAWPLSALATFLIFTWFITSSDSGTLVITTMLSMGDENPPKIFRIIWGFGEGVVAAALLLAGGLAALQTASIAAAFPISFVLLLMAYSLVKSLREDPSAASPPDWETAPDGTRKNYDLKA